MVGQREGWLANAQIPYQYDKILCGNIEEVVNIYKQIETEQNFPSFHDLTEGFNSRFVSYSFIYQSLIDKHCTTSPDSVTICTTHLTTLDPIIINSTFDIPTPTTEMYLRFPISKGEFHSTSEILSEFPKCIVECHDTDNSQPSNTDGSFVYVSVSGPLHNLSLRKILYFQVLCKNSWKSYNSLET